MKALLAAVSILVMLSGCVAPGMPQAGEAASHYLEGEPVTWLERGDVVFLHGEDYVFQEMEYTDGGIRLVMEDSIGQMVETTASEDAIVYVRKELPAGMPSPPPPEPLPVEVPVPVPFMVPDLSPAVPQAPHAPPAPDGTVPAPPTPAPSNDTNATVPAPPPAPAVPVCGNSLLESGEQCEPPGTSTCDSNCMIVIPAPYPSHCSDSVWDGDESDLDCGGSCAGCQSYPAYYSACWDSTDCAGGSCDTSSALPMPAIDPGTGMMYNTVQELRPLAGQAWIIPHQGMCI